MTDLQTKVRRAAKQALHRWMHSEVDGNPMDEIADAVLTVTLQEMLKSLKGQHESAKAAYLRVWQEAKDKADSDYDEGRTDALGSAVAHLEAALQSFGQAPREEQP